MAQVLYEEGRVDESEALVAARLPGIRQGGTIDGALRAYGLLARIAANRRQRDKGSCCWPRRTRLGRSATGRGCAPPASRSRSRCTWPRIASTRRRTAHNGSPC